ncbi:MAG TPA: cytochrome P450 [Gemmatimonadaceae bacterium]|nr:cytochrome P450 [Gemmatimonadaceae bacterium]
MPTRETTFSPDATRVAQPHPPGPHRRVPLLDARRMRRDPLALLGALAEEYGDIVRVPLGPETLYLVNHPDLVRDVFVTNHRYFHKGRGLERAKMLLGEGLLTSEGEFHLRQRRLAQPAFHRQRIAAYGATMASYAAARRDRWHAGQVIDAHREMMALTLAIVGKTLFDADLEGEAGEIGEALTTTFESLNIWLFLPFGELLERLPLPATLRFRRARARLDATIYRLIDERRRSGTDHGDLLSMLLLAQDTEGDGGRMTDLQLRDEAMTIFLAGHETTANALTWTWYLLSQHPDIEARMHAEVDSALGGGAPGVEDLPRLPYTRMVLAESMRLYPPAWIVGRRAIAPFDMRGYTIPARSIILLCQYLMHRDARWFPDPTRFDPDRWTPERQAERPKFSYFPFGGGPRVCIGEQFAWMEGVLLLATIAQRWRLGLVPGHLIALQPIITLRPRFGMKMVVGRWE